MLNYDVTTDCFQSVHTLFHYRLIGVNECKAGGNCEKISVKSEWISVWTSAAIRLNHSSHKRPEIHFDTIKQLTRIVQSLCWIASLNSSHKRSEMSFNKNSSSSSSSSTLSVTDELTSCVDTSPESFDEEDLTCRLQWIIKRQLLLDKISDLECRGQKRQGDFQSLLERFNNIR